MTTRILLLVGLLATSTIAFSGGVAETTGLEITQPAAANCIETGTGECLSPHCTVADLTRKATGLPVYCTM